MKERKLLTWAKFRKSKGAVEGWLATVQDAMRDTLKRLVKQGNIDYANSERKQWVLTHFGQVVATIAQVQWCSATEYYINEMSVNPFSL